MSGKNLQFYDRVFKAEEYPYSLGGNYMHGDLARCQCIRYLIVGTVRCGRSGGAYRSVQ
jgi:hypothetical protein